MLLTNQNHFKKMEEGNSEGSKKRTSGSLYTVEERLDTFKGSHWPFESGSCTPLKVNLLVVQYFEVRVGFVCCSSKTQAIIIIFLFKRWQKLDFITVVHPLILIGYVVLFVIMKWMVGRRQMILGNNTAVLELECNIR